MEARKADSIKSENKEQKEDTTTQFWTKVFSTKKNAYYWFNTRDGRSQWTDPTEIPLSTRDLESIRQSEETFERSAKKQKIEDTSLLQHIKIAVIVPFRDIHVEQKRSLHLTSFIPALTRFLSKSTESFRIYIIEQSNDNRKFNRGKLLNIGFDLACKDHAQIFIFHDVDLIPSDELLKHYTTIPSQPVHIARVWSRYSGNPDYFGGVVSFSKEQFRLINGFPNNFWGWGGEDDEMMKRVKRNKLHPSAPTSGSITDLENMSIDDKIQLLRQHRNWKCPNKWEVLEEHDSTWKENGLSNLKYEVLRRNEISPSYHRILVDVQLNGHYTDSLSGLIIWKMTLLQRNKDKDSENIKLMKTKEATRRRTLMRKCRTNREADSLKSKNKVQNKKCLGPKYFRPKRMLTIDFNTIDDKVY
eukprot:gene6369-12876_t